MPEELENTDDLQTQAETEVQEEPTSPNFKEPLKKYKLEDKWKTDDPVELVDEMGKSYANAQEALRERERELAEARRMIEFSYQRLVTQQQQQQQQQQPANRPLTEEEIQQQQARKFILDETKPIIEEQLAPLRQQNQSLQTQLYVALRMNDPNEVAFREAVTAKELGRKMEMMNLPFTEQGVDYAFNAIMYEKAQGLIARSREEARSEGEQTERQRQKAQLETGGRSNKPPSLSVEDVQKATENMSEAEFDAYCKKNGIKLPT